LLLLSGCGTVKQWVRFYNPEPVVVPDYQNMTYMEILNREMKMKHAKRPPKRMILFYGTLGETKQEAGVKVIVPF
jgi:hypothetical protein